VSGPQHPGPGDAGEDDPPDGDRLLEEFKMMFNATEEGDNQ
jgi:hypothetical protein